MKNVHMLFFAALLLLRDSSPNIYTFKRRDVEECW